MAEVRPDTPRRARSILPMLGDDSQLAAGRRRAIAVVAESDGAEAGNLSFGAGQFLMTSDDRSARRHEVAECGGKLRERGMDCRWADVSDRIDPHHPGLEFGDFDERAVDRILNRTDLGSNFESGIFKHLFAHGGSFPGAR